MNRSRVSKMPTGNVKNQSMEVDRVLKNHENEKNHGIEVDKV